ncbi:murein biosynthesis integral membrane protein MurJ [Neoactinobaculum massilliense]|uniref:murein biosynthesis integral membrane protein MurJ n=1 Tax=Neoactinobaculum massilliense TaxID=2364794 RepID=UPI001F14D369|nr:lipid II flippase MurJ [Neoactinobaculum massilliense]
MRSLRRAALSAAGSIAALTLLSRLIGFVRVWVQNWAVGATEAGEAYSTANTVPNVLFEVVAGGALAAAVIPLVSGFLARQLQDEADRTVSALLTWVVALTVPMALLLTAGANAVVTVLLPAAKPDEMALGATLLRTFSWQVPLYGLAAVCTGVLQAHRHFVLPALAPALSSVTVIAAFAVFQAVAAGQQAHPAALSTAAVYVLGWGTTLGVVAFSLPQLIPVLRLSRVRPTLRFPAGVGRRAATLAAAGIGGVVAQQVQIVAIMVFANARGDVGTYPVYTFANQVYMVPYAVLAVPIATAVYPRLAEAAALPGRPGLARLTAASTRLVVDVGILCVALLAAVAVPAEYVFAVVRPVDGMAHALVCMAPGLLGYSLIYHCSRVLFATDRPRAVAAVNVGAWLGVAAVVAGYWLAGTQGRASVLTAIGVGISVGMSVAAVGQLWAVHRAVGHRALAGVGRSALIMVPAATVAGLAGWWVARWILTAMGHSVLGALIAAGAGGILTLGLGAATIVGLDRSALTGTRHPEFGAPKSLEVKHGTER